MRAAATVAALIALGCWSSAMANAQESDVGERLFETSIRPLLVDRCLECHGDQDPMANLRLTSRESLLQGGDSGPAAVAGDPANSLLLTAVGYHTDLQMPPDGRLSDLQIADLTQWIEIGLPWPQFERPINAADGEMTVTDADRQHWAFQSIRDEPVPVVSNRSWPRNEIDSFVLSRLEAAGLQPAPPADRRTLLRRVYYDLIGLPPTYQEIESFVADESADAWEKVVERLLASRRYGERWGRHWLDVARYADTKDGVLLYGADRLRPYAYTYRDYVIRAFNEDLPFDQFVAHQLAADLIEPPVESWQLAALGFLTLGRQFDNNVHDVIDDQIDTTTRGFMGLTVSCARCHDHKYDPIPTADYYSLYGVMASCEVPAELPEIGDGPLSMDAEAFECGLYAKRRQLQDFVAEQHAFLNQVARERTGDYLATIAAEPVDPLESAIFFLSLTPEDLRPAITHRWRRYLREHAQPQDPVFGIWHDLMQIDVSQSADPGSAFAATASSILQRWQSVPSGTGANECNPRVLQALESVTLNSTADVALAYGRLLRDALNESRELDGERPLSDNDEKNATRAAPAGPAHGPADTISDTAARQQLRQILDTTDSPCWIALSQTHRFMSRAEVDRYWAMLKELDVMAATSPVARPRAMVVVEKDEAYDPRIFVRGNPTQLGRPVPRQFVAIASTGSQPIFGGGSGRLQLAAAITAPDNPLTARVLANRVWMHHFGEPLVATPSDFGRRSDPPTHPQLLDHLATVLVRDGWSLKSLHRRILLSHAYQMDSAVSPAALAAGMAADPDNYLLWRMHRRRLDFEAMRDTLLAVSARMQQRDGGRPVDLLAEPAPNCRTVYGLVDRQSLPGLFRVFDFANPDQTIERRPRTMMPQQALFAMNSAFALSTAKAIAQQPEIQGAKDDAQRIASLYRAILARDPRTEEIDAALAFVQQQPAAESQLTGWEQLAQVLISCNELMYVD